MKQTENKANLTELVLILDRSGSMHGLESDTIGGCNSLLAKQKKEPGEALVTTVLFDDENELLHNRIPLPDVAPLTDREYFVRGCTALYDAIGQTVETIRAAQKSALPADRPAHTLVAILTDGMENASTHYTGEQVRSMVRACQELGWEFLFLGANIDAIAAARQVGISADRSVNYQPDAAGTALNYEVVSQTVSQLRVCGSISPEWKERIDRDFCSRGRGSAQN